MEELNLINEDKMQLKYFLNQNQKTVSNVFFKNESEWDNSTGLLEKQKKEWKHSDHAYLEQWHKDCSFWDKTNLPKNVTFFHPVKFLSLMEKVLSSAEFNPYENANIAYYASPTDRKNGKPSYCKVKDNPGFAPLYDDKESYEYEGQGRFGKVTGCFNEDYQYLEAYKNRFSEFYHEGLDLRGSWDKTKPNEKQTPVKALITCKVIAYGWYSTYGQVIFLHKLNDVGIYLIAHLSKYADDITTGKIYSPGETVGYVGASGNHKLDHWDNPHLHISYYNFQYDASIIINMNSNEISISDKVYSKLVAQRKNPFIHNSEPRKPNKDLKGNIVQ